jgi:catechol 2,3-dioxygenase-like lactoylglutathione lyase family enzyme
MDHKITHCFLYVDDQDAALRFYTGPVGLELRVDARMEHMRWLTVGPASQPEVELSLMAVGEPIPPADRPVVAELLAKGSLPGVIFSTGDCDATFERLVAAGAEVIQGPTDQAYGVRDCAVRDPSGNHVRFSEPLPAAG